MPKSFIVDTTCNNMRLDRWLRNKLGKIPQGLIEKNLRLGKIKVNRKKVKSSLKVQTNDEVDIFDFKFKEKIYQKKRLFIPSNEIIKSNEDLIIDNNNDFIVLNKSAGISVQGGTKSKKKLIDIFSKSEIFQGSKPYSVHRLDKDTSGVFIMAKNRKTAQFFTSLFRLRKIHKTYLAIVIGEFPKKTKKMEDYLEYFENNKKIKLKATTFVKILKSNGRFSFLELDPKTGRKHQLRKQLFLRGFPIIGDPLYGSRNKFSRRSSEELKKIISNLKRQALHAEELQLNHPSSGELLSFKASMPSDMQTLLNQIKVNGS